MTFAALALTACTTARQDPAFESTVVAESSTADCPPQRQCVEVIAPVLGNQEGLGSCSLYGPDDPDHLDPLAESGDLDMRPGEVIAWATDVPSQFDVKELNPVCRPMVEG
jgi:hypothetical protein